MGHVMARDFPITMRIPVQLPNFGPVLADLTLFPRQVAALRSCFDPLLLIPSWEGRNGRESGKRGEEGGELVLHAKKPGVRRRAGVREARQAAAVWWRVAPYLRPKGNRT